MQFMFLVTGLLLNLSVCTVDAQVVKDPLLDYYQRVIKSGLYRENDASDFAYSPQTRLVSFEADFTGSKQKSIFITDEGQYLNAHGKYGWAIYSPMESGGYRMVTDESTLIAAGPDGPPYVGYVDEIKKYGVVTGAKYSVRVDYQDNGTIKSQEIEADHGLVNAYPKYFGDKGRKRHVTTYTLAQLAQKYTTPAASNVIAPASN